MTSFVEHYNDLEMDSVNEPDPTGTDQPDPTGTDEPDPIGTGTLDPTGSDQPASLEELMSRQAVLLQQLDSSNSPSTQNAENSFTNGETEEVEGFAEPTEISMPGLQPFPVGKNQLPSSWSDCTLSGDVPFCLVMLNSKSWEFQGILAEFAEVTTATGSAIRKIERIENRDLWEKFEFERKRMQKNRTEVNEVYLYHGTLAEKEQICHEGLDQRLSRIGYFGRGIYFSNDPRKCMSYTQNESSGQPTLHHTTFMVYKCRVLLGNMKVYPQGQHAKDLKREPALENPEPGGPKYYDSVQGHVSEFDEFIIYKSERVMPEYIISCNLPPAPSLDQRDDAKEEDLYHGDDATDVQRQGATFLSLSPGLQEDKEELYFSTNDEELSAELAAGAVRPSTSKNTNDNMAGSAERSVPETGGTCDMYGGLLEGEELSAEVQAGALGPPPKNFARTDENDDLYGGFVDDEEISDELKVGFPQRPVKRKTAALGQADGYVDPTPGHLGSDTGRKQSRTGTGLKRDLYNSGVHQEGDVTETQGNDEEEDSEDDNFQDGNSGIIINQLNEGADDVLMRGKPEVTWAVTTDAQHQRRLEEVRSVMKQNQASKSLKNVSSAPATTSPTTTNNQNVIVNLHNNKTKEQEKDGAAKQYLQQATGNSPDVTVNAHDTTTRSEPLQNQTQTPNSLAATQAVENSAKKSGSRKERIAEEYLSIVLPVRERIQRERLKEREEQERSGKPRPEPPSSSVREASRFHFQGEVPSAWTPEEYSEHLKMIARVREKVQADRRTDEEHKKQHRVMEKQKEKQTTAVKQAPSSPDDGGEAVHEVLDTLIVQFMDFTACEDIDEAREFVSRANSDVNQAIVNYLNS